MIRAPALPPLKHQRLQAAGVELHVAIQGDGPPVLLLHGFPDHWELWQPLMSLLSPQYRLMAPDLRGYNESDKPRELQAYHINTLVADVRALIHTLGGRCIVVGHDWGGMLAWAVAARYPQEVVRLVVLNAPHPCRFAQLLRLNAAQRQASAYVQRLCEPGTEARLAANNFALLWSVISNSMQGPTTEADRLKSIQAWSRPGALRAMLNWYRVLDFESAMAPLGLSALPDLDGASGEISMPTLVIWGEQDGSFPIMCLEGLQQWVPRLQLHCFPNGGHWLLREDPEAVAKLIGDFLQQELTQR